MNQVLMLDQSQELGRMQLISNGNNNSEGDFFYQVLQGDIGRYQSHQIKISKEEKEQDNGNHYFFGINHIIQDLQNQPKPIPIFYSEPKCQQRVLPQKDSKMCTRAKRNIQKSFKSKNDKRSMMTTNCNSIPVKQQAQIVSQVKITNSLVDFTAINNEASQDQSKQYQKKQKKIKGKFSKHIFKQKSFGKALKISFPKKIVEMFLNHYENIQIQSSYVKDYNDNLKFKLKKSKKNDYTFDKEISQILGENKESQQQQLVKVQEQVQSISLINRQIISQIIRQKMKQQVIMRDKIAKNRQLYMLQLKVYSLRCRCHKLSKKGTYK